MVYKPNTKPSCAVYGGVPEAVAYGRTNNGRLKNDYDEEDEDNVSQQQNSTHQFFGAIGDMARNYFDMKQDNTIGGDDYFHCKANYEASSRGNIGRSVAEILGNAKEEIDYWDNQLRKGHSVIEAADDKIHDKYVNKIGRQRAQSDLYSNSKEACHSFRVRGINDKY